MFSQLNEICIWIVRCRNEMSTTQIKVSNKNDDKMVNIALVIVYKHNSKQTQALEDKQVIIYFTLLARKKRKKKYDKINKADEEKKDFPILSFI